MPRKQKSSSSFGNPKTFVLACQKCGEKTTHKVTHVKSAVPAVAANGTVYHLRCQTCRKVLAYLLELDKNNGVLEATVLDFHALLENQSPKNPHPYKPRDTFAEGQFIKHQIFGEGYVLAVHNPPVKMYVMFADKHRVIVCGTWPGRESGFAEEPAANPPAIPAAACSPGDEVTVDPKDRTATCPKCGKNVHPLDLYRAADGKSTTGCTSCV